MTHHLVTGGAGFVGSALARRLVENGEEVTVLDRFSRGKSERLPEEVRQIKGDVRCFADVAEAVKDAECIWHLAYVQGTATFYSDPKDVIEVALRGIMNVLDVCAGQDLILVSSSEVYQNPLEGMFPTDETVPLSVPDVTNPRYSYGGGKIASELATLAYSQAGHINRGMIVRPHNVYGADMGNEHVIPEFAVRMMELEDDQFPIQGTGEETRSFCHIDDCVDGLMAVYEKGEDRNVYHLGNPNEEWSISRLAHAVADYFAKRVEVVPGQLPQGSPTRRLPDIGKLKALGFNPQVTLAAGLPETLDWYVLNTEVAA